MPFPIRLQNLVIHCIEEDWTSDSVFAGTFAGSESIDLCSISIEISDPTTLEDFVLQISPSQPGHYGSYSETGRGLSSEILTRIIGLLTSPSEGVTPTSFIQSIVAEYSDSYTIRVNNVIQNRVVYVREGLEIPEGYPTVIQITDIFSFERDYSLRGEIIGELNSQNPSSYIFRFGALNNHLISLIENNSILVIVPVTQIHEVDSSFSGTSNVHVVTRARDF